MGNLHAGASDSIGRMAFAYDILSSCCSADFKIPYYKNKHCMNVDFFELFDITKHYSKILKIDYQNNIIIRLTDLLNHLSNHDNFLQDYTFYKIIADAYEGRLDLSKYLSKYEYKKTFHLPCSYTPKEKLFLDQCDLIKVVVHLRRSDICGNAILCEVEDRISDLDKNRLQKIQSRKFLEVSDAILELEGLLKKNQKIQIIIASDGFYKTRKMFSKSEVIQDQISILERKIFEEPFSSNLRIIKTDYIIGNDELSTVKTLDAMYESHYIITASSSFPNLIKKYGKSHTKIINLS